MKNLSCKLALFALIATASSNMYAADIYVPYSSQQSNEQLYNYDQSAQDNNMLPRPADENLNQNFNNTENFDNAGTYDYSNSNSNYNTNDNANQTPKPASDQSDYSTFVDGMGG